MRWRLLLTLDAFHLLSQASAVKPYFGPIVEERIKASQAKDAAPAPNHTECAEKNDGGKYFLKVLKEGLPADGAQAQPNSSVIVVGAGIAGLTAADVLKRAGYKVTVLEASGRVGGRVETYRNIDDGWMGEAGAMRIPAIHFFTHALIDRFKLETEVFFKEGTSPQFVYLRDKKLSQTDTEKLYGKDQPLYQLFNVPEEEWKSNLSAALGHAMMEPMKDLHACKWKTFVDRYDGFTLYQWLKSNANWTEELITMLGVFYNYESVLNDGLLEYIIDDCLFIQDLVLIKDGMDHIVRGFLEGNDSLADLIVYHAKVSEVWQSDKDVKVRIRCRGDYCPFLLDQEYSADYLVWTVSAPATQTARFHPRLSPEKEHALRTCNYAASTKVLLAFKEAFWEEDKNLRSGGVVNTDLPVQSIYYQPSTSFSELNGAVLLATYSWGPYARRQSAVSDKELIEECLQVVAAVHGMTYRDLQALFLDGTVKKWLIDPHSLGAFAFGAPYHYVELQDDLAKREGRILFAGEHTGNVHAWMDTAIKSAVRAADEIHHNKDWTLNRGYKYTKKVENDTCDGMTPEQEKDMEDFVMREGRYLGRMIGGW